MTNDLMERYIYAVTRRMSSQVRQDVSDELRTLIDDMLTERCGGAEPDEQATKAVLTELGSPQELYEKYDADHKKCLIGAPYYSTYQFVLKIVLLCVAFGLCVSGIVTQITSPPETWYAGAAQWLGLLWTGLTSAFAYVTLLFALFYYKGIQINNQTSLDDLPPVPRQTRRISRWECIFGIGFSVVFLIVFLAAPQIFCVFITEPKEFIPIFNLETVRSTWYIIALFCAVGIVRESVNLMEGQYNKRVLITTCIADLVSAVLAFWWLLNDQIMNPAFADRVATIFAQEDDFIRNIFANFQYFFLLMILLALLLDAVTAIVKTTRR